MSDGDTAAAPSSIKDRIAALNRDHLAHPPAYDHAASVASKKAKPPPPPRPVGRSQSSNIPSQNFSTETIGNTPAGVESTNGGPQVGSRTVGVNQKTVLPAPTPMTGRKSSDSGVSINGGDKPGLPPRLPPRRPGAQPDKERRASVESTASSISMRSSLSTGTTQSSGTGRSMAPEYDPSKLPQLPPKRTAEQKAEDERKRTGRPLRPSLPNRTSTKSTAASTTSPSAEGRPPLPSRTPTQTSATSTISNGTSRSAWEQNETPPALPSRPALPTRPGVLAHSNTEPPPASQPAKPRRSALEFGMNKKTEVAPSIPQRPGGVPGGSPPPVPISSRPDLKALQASKPSPSAASTPNSSTCLVCRDYSAPDSHAARFPRENVPSQEVSWLSYNLTKPFTSPTDKARAIFKWLHFNITYDVFNFVNKTVKPSTPASTIASGMAVCEGYAGLFAALAVEAGLEAVVVGGHGKGAGFVAWAPGRPVPPPDPSGHAWNAVHLETGWKVIDPCWGAGHGEGEGHAMVYKAQFAPEQFVMSNEDFGQAHFPSDARFWHRTDGRSLSWQEYIVGEGFERVEKFGLCSSEFIPERSIQPANRLISLDERTHGQWVRFSFAHPCAHWRPAKHHPEGADMPYVLKFNPGPNAGYAKDLLPFETDGNVFWCDIERRRLGSPGEQVMVYSITTLNGKDARGISVQDLKRNYLGKAGMSFGGLCKWELVP